MTGPTFGGSTFGSGVFGGLVPPAAGEVIVSIGGTDRSFRSLTLNISAVTNGFDTLTGDVISLDGSYRPTMGDEIIVTLTGVTVFGGTVTGVTEVGLGGVGLTSIVHRISASDFNSIAQRKYVNATLAAGTLKSMLTTLVSDYLDDYGVTLHASQANGATLAAVTFAYRRVDEVLNDLAAATGWTWEIDYNKVLRMVEPGTVAAPFDVVENDGHAIGDIEVERTAVSSANRIIIVAGSGAAPIEKTETFTATSGQTSFPLTYPVNQGSDAANVYRNFPGYVTRNSVVETLGATGATWTYDYATNAVVRSSGVTLGQSVVVRYQAKFPIYVTAEDAADISSHGVTERIEVREDIFDRDQAQALADGLLALRLVSQRRVRLRTDTEGLQVGMTMHVTAASRDLDDDCLITGLRTINHAGNRIRFDVDLEVGDKFTGSWRDYYAKTSGGGSSAGSAISVVSPAQRLNGWDTDTNGDLITFLIRNLGSTSYPVGRVYAMTGSGSGLAFTQSGLGYNAATVDVDPSSGAITVKQDNGVAQKTYVLGRLGWSLPSVTVPSLVLVDNSGAGSNSLICLLTSTLSAQRTLSLVTGDANRTFTMTGDATVNQDVSSAGSPTFVAATVKAGGSAITAKVGGQIYQSITGVGNVGTGDDDLISITLAASVLSADGQRLTGEFNGRFASNANAKRLRLKFGATTFLDMGSGHSPNGGGWRLRFTIVRTGATTQRISADLITGMLATSAFSSVTTAGETLSGAVVLKMTGEATSDNDVVNDEAAVYWWPAA